MLKKGPVTGFTLGHAWSRRGRTCLDGGFRSYTCSDSNSDQIFGFLDPKLVYRGLTPRFIRPFPWKLFKGTCSRPPLGIPASYAYRTPVFDDGE